MRRWLPLLLTFALAFGTGACSSRTEVVNVMVSPAEQREDLQRARDMGIISEQEYYQEVSEIGKVK
jgi:hypothetical protein